ncbi:MAG: hemerythrin domain-containing protein [Terricaulis sp.]
MPVEALTDHPARRLSADPLDFLLFEHEKHREMCVALDALAEADAFNDQLVLQLAEFIRVDLTFHVTDEEDVLFPLLQQCCEPSDDIERALARLHGEHQADLDLSARVRVYLLQAVEESRAPSQIPGAREALHAFAQSQRRHMMFENAILIPLARRRFSPQDIEALSRRLAARRALPHSSVRLQEDLG